MFAKIRRTMEMPGRLVFDGGDTAGRAGTNEERRTRMSGMRGRLGWIATFCLVSFAVMSWSIGWCAAQGRPEDGACMSGACSGYDDDMVGGMDEGFGDAFPRFDFMFRRFERRMRRLEMMLERMEREMLGEDFGGAFAPPRPPFHGVLGRFSPRMRGRRPFRGFFRGMGADFGMGFPSVDVKDDGDAFVVKIDVPGVDKKNLDLRVEPRAIFIKGRRETRKEKQDENMFRSERIVGEFYRRIPLPEPIVVEKTTATIKDGVVTVRAPKKEKTGGKEEGVKITIKEL